MSSEQRTEPEGAIWPPPPTQGPPTLAAPPSPPLRKAEVFGQIVVRMMMMGMVLGAACGAAFGLCFAFILGAIFGALYGLCGGILLGLVDGLALAGVTCFGFFPLTHARLRAYRRCTTLIVVLTTLVGAGTLSLLLFSNWGNGTPWGGDTLISLLTTVIATIAAGVACRRVAAWYVTVSGTLT